MDKDKVLTVHWSPTEFHTDSELPQRISVSVNIAVFMLNLLERKFQELESILSSYHAEEAKRMSSVGEHKISVTWGYEKGDILIELVWSIVDWSEKLRKLLSSISGIKKKDDWYKRLMHALDTTKSIRNVMQHFDGELGQFIKDSTPLMGVVAAQFPLGVGRVTHVISSSTFGSSYKDHINIYGIDATASESASVDKITFSLSKKSINLTDFISNIRGEVEFMKDYLKEKYKHEWPKSVNKVHNFE